MNDLIQIPSALSGYIRIYRQDPATGKSDLVVSQPNTILYSGAEILASCLGGNRYAPISRMYVVYATTVPVGAVITKATQGYTIDEGTGEGFVRLPLTTTPSYLTSNSEDEATPYNNNIVVFTATLLNPSLYLPDGAPQLTTSSKFYQVALVSAMSPSGTLDGDKTFARTSFSPVLYNPSYNWSIHWGIRVTA